MKWTTARVAVVGMLVAALLCGGCGGSSQQARILKGDNSNDKLAPAAGQLESILAAELDRLGKDPHRTPSAAPQGEDNRVFFLTATVQDPDGMGPQVPDSVTLRWVERCTGDYNQDGLVGVSDLTPLGQRFNEQVAYHDPELREIACWPVGPPLDDGGAGAGNPPVPGSPADNWRLARIDGNTDGLIGVSDITPIAQHWQERLNGYRVYRIRPGETGFTALPNADDPGLGYTVPRAAAFPPGSTSADPTRPVHYEFVDDQLGAASGWYEYYVVPYDASADEEGMPSHPVPADMGNGGGGSIPPHALVEADVEFGAAPLEVTFDAAASWDLDGVIVKYEWDMDGDPSGWEYDSTPDTTVQWTYNSAGTHDQWVRVTDNDGLTATAHYKVPVSSPGGNLPPVAMVAGLPPEGEVPQLVTWDAGASFDHDGSIVKYEWDMDGDHTTWEYDSGSTATMEITYNTGGPKTQYVRITDDGGWTDTAFGMVHMFGGNQPPVAAIVPDVTEGDAPLLVNFDASGSSDPDGNIQQYEWDFDSDSVIDATTAVPTASYTYNDPGDYSPTVFVTDDVGATDNAWANLTVHGWVITTVDAGPNAGLYCSAALIEGVPGIAYNWDNWPTNGELRYTLAQNAQGTMWPSSPVVVDDGGGTNHVGSWSSLAAVNGNPAIGYFDGGTIQLKYIRASDQFGAAWPSTPVVVDNSGSAGQQISLAVIDGYPAMSYFVLGTGNLSYVRATDANGGSWAARVDVNPGPNVAMYTTLLEFQGTSTIPLIAHVDTSSQQLLFERANNSVGSLPWNPTEALCPAGECTEDGSMAIVDGLPAVVYYGTDSMIPGLFYRRLQSSSSWAWGSAQRLLTGIHNGVDADLKVVNGYPAVAYRLLGLDSNHDLMYLTATDSTGANWGTPEYVDFQDDVGHYASLVDISGHPGIAYQDYTNGQLKFAYRY